MAMLADTVDAVIGVDTHTDTHTACLMDRLGRQLAVITIAADPGGCRRLLAWARQHAPGPQLAWSVEGTRSHGLGLTRYLQAQGQQVTEAGRPERASKRPGGKSDPADAARAAGQRLQFSARAAVVGLVRFWLWGGGLVEAVDGGQGEAEVADFGEHAVQGGLVGE